MITKIVLLGIILVLVIVITFMVKAMDDLLAENFRLRKQAGSLRADNFRYTGRDF